MSDFYSLNLIQKYLTVSDFAVYITMAASAAAALFKFFAEPNRAQ